MMKLLTFIRRREGMTTEAFEQHWRHNHGTLVEKHREAIRLVRYVQTHVGHEKVFETFNDGRGGAESVSELYDGVAELYWESEEAFWEGMTTEEGAAAWREIAADEPNFVSYATTYNFIGNEVLIVEAADWKAPK